MGFAFLFFLSLIALSVLVRAFQGENKGWALIALSLLAPSLALAWRDWIRVSARR